MNRLIELANLILLRWDDPRRHQPDCLCVFHRGSRHGEYKAWAISSMKEAEARAKAEIHERAVALGSFTDQEWHDVMVLAERWPEMLP